MKKTQATKSGKTSLSEMRSEYHFDYRKARSNRFAARADQTPLVVLVDSDVAEVFTTSESVNHALRALIAAMPKTTRRRAGHE